MNMCHSRVIWITLWFTSMVGVGAGCGDQDSSPVPQPVPDFIRESTPGLKQTDKLVLGLPGAVAGSGQVHLTDQATGRRVSAPSAAAGSFNLVIIIDQTKTPQLVIQFENADGVSEPVSLATRQLTYGPTLGPSKGGLAQAPDAKGNVLVSNDGGAGNPLLVDASPNMTLILTVVSSGLVTSSTTDSQGRFSATVKAASGDTLGLLLVDPQDQGATSDFITASVP